MSQLRRLSKASYISQRNSKIEIGCRRLAAALLSLWVDAIACAANPPAAFIEPDTLTGRLPVGAYSISRHGKPIAADGALAPCDVITFDGQQTSFLEVRIKTFKSGKLILLDRAHPKSSIPCDEITLTAAAIRIFTSITNGPRSAQPQSIMSYKAGLATRMAPFHSPALLSDQSRLVAGRRALVVSWHGGKAPFLVELIDVTSGQSLARVTSSTQTYVTLPELDLAAGRYSLLIHSTPAHGPGATLREDNLLIVASSELPPEPEELANSQISREERTLLYSMYLEGIGDGRWTFEALQFVAFGPAVQQASRAWLKTYGFEK